jgi:hypothetical protein
MHRFAPTIINSSVSISLGDAAPTVAVPKALSHVSQCHSICFPPCDTAIDSSMYTQQSQARTDFIYRDSSCQSLQDYLSSIVSTPHNISTQYSVVKNMTLSFNECNQSLKFVTNNRPGRRVTQFAQFRKNVRVTATAPQPNVARRVDCH